MDSLKATSPSSLLLHQCNDLVHLQGILLTRSVEEQQESSFRQTSESRSSRVECEALHKQLQEEQLSHAEAMASLAEEREKVGLAETEVRVIQRQLDREKDTFEQAFGLLKNQAIADSSKAESLVAKCSALEALCARKDEELSAQRSELKTFHKKMEQLKLAHKMEVQELNIRLQQEIYMADNVGSSRTSTKTTLRTKRKQKH
ncbi:spermatogenesis-associated protein 24-like [Halichondria panicea]|uniref:spermatogenesis-associated protein 24-like n=1 Tax=Halichondria panicea TaxID=6063 RepID=UPI00312B51C3